MGAVGLLLPTLAACGAPARVPPQAAATVTVTGITGHGTVGLGIIGLVVADLVRSLTFYRRLGLDVPTDVTGDSYRLALPHRTTFFWESAAVIRTFDPAWQPPSGDRRVMLEFGFDTADTLDATYDSLTDGGAPPRLPPFWLTPDIRYAILTDPDDNQISLRYPAAG